MRCTTTFTLADLARTVRGRPLASDGVCGGCYSFSYSPTRGRRGGGPRRELQREWEPGIASRKVLLVWPTPYRPSELRTSGCIRPLGGEFCTFLQRAAMLAGTIDPPCALVRAALCGSRLKSSVGRMLGVVDVSDR